jgi:predicted oxidoreductase
LNFSSSLTIKFAIIPDTISSRSIPYGDFILSKKIIGGTFAMSKNLNIKNATTKTKKLFGSKRRAKNIPATSSITTS